MATRSAHFASKPYLTRRHTQHALAVFCAGLFSLLLALVAAMAPRECLCVRFIISRLGFGGPTVQEHVRVARRRMDIAGPPYIKNACARRRSRKITQASALGVLQVDLKSIVCQEVNPSIGHGGGQSAIGFSVPSQR